MRRPDLTEFTVWTRTRRPSVDVVGEHHHRDDIRRLYPKRLTRDRELMVTAHLVPEPDNKHDSNAVRVEVDGALIGYLAREVAPGYAQALGVLVGKGFLPTTTCRIFGWEQNEYRGTDRHGEPRFATVFAAEATLVLDDPHLLAPANAAPAGHVPLPAGTALQVQGEERHLEVLAPYVDNTFGETAVWATLHPCRSAGGKETLELRIDDARIGTLTPAMASHYLPVVRRLESTRRVPAAHVYLKGNPLRVEATLRAARAHELTAEWLTTHGLDLDASEPGTESPSAPPATALAAAGSGAPRPDSAAVRPPRADDRQRRVGDMTPPFTLPPAPAVTFRPPPGWPPPPAGWTPPPGWQPMPDWPAPPADWEYWALGPAE